MRRTIGQKLSRKQEKDTAQRYGGQLNPGSGNGTHRKNDVRTDSTSIECKITTKDSYRLTLPDLEKAEFNALLDNRSMVFKITFAGGSQPKSYVVIAEDDYWNEYVT